MPETSDFIPEQEDERERLSRKCCGDWEQIEMSVHYALGGMTAQRYTWGVSFTQLQIYFMPVHFSIFCELLWFYPVFWNKAKYHDLLFLLLNTGWGLTSQDKFLSESGKGVLPKVDKWNEEALMEAFRENDMDFFVDLGKIIKGEPRKDLPYSYLKGKISGTDELAWFILKGWCHPGMPLIQKPDQISNIELPFCFWTNLAIAQYYHHCGNPKVTRDMVEDRIKSMQLVAAKYEMVTGFNDKDGSITPIVEKFGVITQRRRCESDG